MRDYMNSDNNIDINKLPFAEKRLLIKVISVCLVCSIAIAALF